MCDFLLRDLCANCPGLDSMANAGEIVYQTNYTVNKGTRSEWNIDLVMGPGASKSILPGTSIAKADPSEIWIAVDAKAIMTEHGKARRNRQRDLNSMGEILRRKNPVPVAGAYVVVNMADSFRSPLRNKITQHKNIERIVTETVSLMMDVLKNGKAGRPGLDAVGITVIDYTNTEGSECQLVEGPPAPDSNSPLHYDRFISALCAEFSQRFGR